MALLKHWRVVLIILLVAWSVILVHPFSKEGVLISKAEEPASTVFRAGDVLTSVNDDTINSVDDFEEAVSEIEPDDTVKATALRETFPYNYREFTHLYLAKETEDGTADVALAVQPASFSKIEFSNEIRGGNKFTIDTPNPEHTIEVLKDRFKITKVSDHTFYTEGDKLILRSTYGKEISPIIENSGKIEAKVAGEIFFTNEDVETYCKSGVDCLINLYPKMKQTENETSVEWKFGFETKITEEAADRFIDLTNGLSIESCEFDTCILNDTIEYYLDGELIGYEEIYAESKGKDYGRPFIGGYAATKEAAAESLYFTQAALVGELDTEIEEIEPVGPTLDKDFVLMTFGTMFLVIIIGSAVAAAQIKSGKVFLVGAGISASEILIVLGAIAGLNFIVRPLTLIGMLSLPIITAVYQNYLVIKIKKESFILKKIAELNSKLNKFMLIALVVIAILIFVIPEIGSPLMIYILVVLVLSKGGFINAIKEKR